jgi:hypothetical protein
MFIPDTSDLAHYPLSEEPAVSLRLNDRFESFPAGLRFRKRTFLSLQTMRRFPNERRRISVGLDLLALPDAARRQRALRRRRSPSVRRAF